MSALPGATADGASASAWQVAGWRLVAIVATLVGRDDAVLAARERIVAACPRDATALATVAHQRAARGEDATAIALLRTALDLDPTVAASWYNLGFLLQRTGAQDAAIDAFDRAVALDPALDLAHYGRALSLIRSGRLEDAIEPLRRTIALQPMSPHAPYQLAHVYHRLAQPDRVARLIARLAGFEPQVARLLERETGVAAAR